MAEKNTRKPFRKMIALDFDGVIHRYDSPWTTAAEISDGPTPGAMEFLHAASGDPRFEIVVVSSRLNDEAGRAAVHAWLARELVAAFGETEGASVLRDIRLSQKRPPAVLTLDDRAWQFEGRWPSLDAIAAFRPWNKRPAVEKAADRDAGRAEVDELIAATERARGLLSLLETAWSLGAATAYARRDRAAEYEADGRSDDEIRAADVERVLAKANRIDAVPERARRYADAKASSSLDRDFASYADVEAIIAAAAPPGTPISRACAGGELGWRVGFGWLSSEGASSSRPDVMRDVVRGLAAIPARPGEKPREGDPAFVAKTLAAGRAM